MRLMRYSNQIVHVPGKDLISADALFRAPTHRQLTEDEKELNEELNVYVSQIVHNLPGTEHRLMEVRLQQDEDEVCRKLKEFCSEGWPDKNCLNEALKAYWQCTDELTIQHSIPMKGTRVVIPSALRLEVLDQIHTGHQWSRNAAREQKKEFGGQASADNWKT